MLEEVLECTDEESREIMVVGGHVGNCTTTNLTCGRPDPSVEPTRNLMANPWLSVATGRCGSHRWRIIQSAKPTNAASLSLHHHGSRSRSQLGSLQLRLDNTRLVVRSRDGCACVCVRIPPLNSVTPVNSGLYPPHKHTPRQRHKLSDTGARMAACYLSLVPSLFLFLFFLPRKSTSRQVRDGRTTSTLDTSHRRIPWDWTVLLAEPRPE